jgi:hypothetical protein
MTLAPSDGKVILGYARALARSDKEVEAACLLQTALVGGNRVDIPEDRVFLLTLLAEVQRRTGQFEAALRTFTDEFGEDILPVCRKAGCLPGVEFVEVLLVNGRTDQARTVAGELLKLFPDEAFVQEIAAAAGVRPQAA